MKILYIVFLLILFSCAQETEKKNLPEHEHEHEEPLKEEGSQKDTTIIIIPDHEHETPKEKPIEKPVEKPKEDLSGWSTRDIDIQHREAFSNTLVGIRTSENKGYARIVFEFLGPDLPSLHVSYIDRPVYQCGSGAVTPLPGDAWLEIRMSPVNAHTEQGQPTIPFREKKLRYSNLLELESTCDFEAVTTWVAAVKSPNRFRVIELRHPTRVVVDIRN